jgi:para-nitrobenzyl esterase
MAQLLSGAGMPVWRYEFDLAQDGGRSSHGSELPYIFGEAKLAGGLSLQSYWLNFARTGDPNGPGLPPWPRFKSRAQRHVTFEAAGVTVGAKLREPLCSLLEAL